MSMPAGGVVGHPMGSGKTRIVLALAAADHAATRSASGGGSAAGGGGSAQGSTAAAALRRTTLVLAPDHLIEQWRAEAAAVAGAAAAVLVMGFGEVEQARAPAGRPRRERRPQRPHTAHARPAPCAVRWLGPPPSSPAGLAVCGRRHLCPVPPVWRPPVWRHLLCAAPGR